MTADIRLGDYYRVALDCSGYHDAMPLATYRTRSTMSVNVYLKAVAECPHCHHSVPTERVVYSANTTHNLRRMAQEAGIYLALWRPEEMEPPAVVAADIVEPLRAGLALMRADPARFEAFNASNGWGLYRNFVPWIERYLKACEANPSAMIQVSR